MRTRERWEEGGFACEDGLRHEIPLFDYYDDTQEEMDGDAAAC